MNFADRMRQIGAAIAGNIPTLTAVESVANEGMTILAAAVPGAAPVVAAVQAVEHVGNQVADLVVQTTTTTTVPAPPVSQTPPTPIADDSASLAADALAGAANATTSQLHARILALENALVEIAPLLSQLAGKFNL